ncbi:hypothetical protein NQ318_005861 [Aromia moschata]|uniref:Uncharacterized protein n=1 Tax=Aromia moschata TaxID=1265417 RepID=A0AAV8YUF6_9CUCU|nr:hypothetical protein NQ318_005861 [Aromia moschata]
MLDVLQLRVAAKIQMLAMLHLDINIWRISEKTRPEAYIIVPASSGHFPAMSKKSNRKRKFNKAEILTSTPIKTELKKLNTSNAKVKKLPKEMTNKGKQTGARMKKQRKKNTNDTEKEETYCGICGESYEEINGKTQRRLDHVQ